MQLKGTLDFERLYMHSHPEGSRQDDPEQENGNRTTESSGRRTIDS